jgi:beta-fructofuranosidase
LICDRSSSSLDPETEKDPRAGKLNLKTGELLELHIFVDRSIIEIIANEKFCITQRVYPTKPDSKGVGFSLKGGNAIVKSIQAWQMSPVWPIK